MGKRFNTVEDMLHSSGIDKEFQKEVKQTIEERRLCKTLFAMRTAKGITQADIAKRLNCTQSRISKIENGTDEDLKMRDILDYISVLKLDLSVSFTKSNSTAVDRVKHHAFCIKRELDKMAELAHEDDGILEGVVKFYVEYISNIENMFNNSINKLPKDKKRKHVLRINSPVDAEQFETANR